MCRERLQSPQGSTLTIEPGVIVKFGNLPGITVIGALIAEGTAQDKIVFTSVWDDAYGGNTDPNNYGEGYPTEPGQHPYTSGGNGYIATNYWGYISFYPGSMASTINHSVLRYGGAYNAVGVIGQNTILDIQSSSVTISNSEMSQAWGDGIKITNASPVITGNMITGNEQYGIELSGSNAVITGNTVSNNKNHGIIARNTAGPVITGNTVNENQGYAIYFDGTSDVSGVGDNSMAGNTSVDGVWIDGFMLAKDTTFTANHGVYVFGSSLTIPEGVTLTIEPGVIVKFGNLAVISVIGALIAEGTAQDKIVFTSVWDDAYGGNTDPNNYGEGYPTSPGSIRTQAAAMVISRPTTGATSAFILAAWPPRSITAFSGTAGRTMPGVIGQNTILDIQSSSVTISNSEISQAWGDGIKITYASPVITGNVITGNEQYGIELSGSNAVITGNTVSNNKNHGIIARQQSGPVITGNTVNENQGYAIYFDGTSDVSGVGDNSMAGNTSVDGVWINGFMLAKDTTFTANHGVYVFGSSLTIPEGVTLTIEPGVIVKFGNLAVISVIGALIAEGTAQDKIVFTSVWDDAYGGNTDPNNYGEGYPTEPGQHPYTSGGNGYIATNYWGYISFYPGSMASTINHSVLRYGGAYNAVGVIGQNTILDIQSSSVTISNSEISQAWGDGIKISYASPVITGNVITGNEQYGIELSGSNAVITGNTVSNNHMESI